MDSTQTHAPEPVSQRVVENVAATKDTGPLTLDPLYDVIDPDALETLCNGAFDGSVTFQYADCEVTVDGDGWVQVTPSQP